MKKIFNLIAAIFLMGSFFVPVPALAVSDADQYCTVTGGSASLGIQGRTPPGVRQYFKPTKNHINSIRVAVVPNGSTFKLTLEDRQAGKTIFSKNLTALNNGGYWVYANDFDYELDITHNHYIKLEPVSGTTFWYYSNTSCNSSGDAWYSGSYQNQDMGFSTFGYHVNPPAEPVNPATPTPATTTTTPASTTVKAVTAAAAVVPVDASIKAPVLTHIIKNGKKTLAPITKEVVLGQKDKLTLGGTAFADAKVVVIVGEKAYTVTADKSGAWVANINPADFKEANYKVDAQAQNAEGKGSEKVELIKIKVLGVKIGTRARISGWYSGWTVFHTLTAVGLLLLVLLMLALIARRHYYANIGKPKKTEKKKK